MEMKFSCREGGEDDEGYDQLRRRLGHWEQAHSLPGHAVPTGEMMTRSNGGVTTHAEQEGKEA
jgi:hypothetical protein